MYEAWGNEVDRETSGTIGELLTNHILYGDNTGGGHLWPGTPGKTTFPQSWPGDKIMHYASDIATDPSLVWKPNRIVGGIQRYSINGIREGVNIRVITDGFDIITTFPF